MACSARRSITSKLAAASRARFSPSFSHLLPHDRERDGSHCNPGPAPARPPTPQHEFVPPISGFRTVKRIGFGQPFSLGGSHGFQRRYSSSSVGPDAGAGCVRDGGGFFTEKGVEVLTENAGEIVTQAATTAAPAVGEVAAAAADSAVPVAILQHVIDAVHCFTGLNWWASIALTTVFIRLATVPILLHQLKASSKLSAMRPELEELKEQLQNTTDPRDMQEKQRQVKDLFRKHGVSPFTPLKGMLIQGPVFVSFFFAISNMVEKVPSLKQGGALWFTDLTTPDALYAFPILTGLSFLVTVELNMQEGMEGNPMAGSMKKFSRLLAFMTVPFTASFPKAIFCYWITSNLFSLVYGAVLRRPPVRKFLNLPDVNAPPATSQPSISFFGGSKPSVAATSPLITQPSESRERRITSSTVISQRIKNLEKTVKKRGKSKKK